MTDPGEPTNAISPTFGEAWLDNDGRHVWAAHLCNGVPVVTMLPWPAWRSTGLRIEPSVSCEACGFHSIMNLGPPIESHRCMETWEYDGRWCERMAGHSGAHRCDLAEWATYARD